GKRTNQQCVQLPHARFIDHLTYKARLVGIQVMREARALYQSSQLVGPGSHPNLSGKPGRAARVLWQAHCSQLVSSQGWNHHACRYERQLQHLAQKELRHASKWGEEEWGPQFPLDGWPSERMTDRHSGHHVKILHASSTRVITMPAAAAL